MIEVKTEYLSSINPNNFIKYLLSKKWINVNVKNKDVKVFQKYKDNELNQVKILLDKSYIDYYETLKNSLISVSCFESRSLNEIILEINNITSVILKVTLKESTYNYGTTKLNSFTNITNTMFKMIKDTTGYTYDEKEARSFIESCEVGQTQRGSYVIPVILPINKKIENRTEQIDMFPRDTIGYKVTKKIIKNILYLSSSEIDNLNPNSLAHSLKDRQITPNFCDEFLNLVPKNKDADFQIHGLWPIDMKSEEELNAVITLRSTISTTIIRSASKILRESNKEVKSIVGLITKLQADADLDKREGGKISMTFIHKGKQKTITSSLSSEDYKKAIYAHDNELAVSIKGKLTIKKRGGYIISDNFKIIG